MTGEHLEKAKGALAEAQKRASSEAAFHVFLRIAEVQALVAIAEALTPEPPKLATSSAGYA